MKSVKSIVFSVLPWVIIILVGVFFYRTLADNWSNLQDVSLAVDAWTVAGLIAFVMAVVISGSLWGGLLSELSGRKVSLADSVRIHCASWLLKYIPGQVGSFLNKIAWGSKQGISKKTISTSFIYENVLMVFAGFVLSIPVIWIFSEEIGEGLALWLPLLALLPMLVVLYKPVFYWLLNTMFRIIRKKPFSDSDFLSTRSLLTYQVGYLIPRFLNGIGFIFIAISILPVELGMLIGLGSTYILAGILGLLAIMVPSGLGVREAVIVLLVGAYFPAEQAVVLAVVARLYATVADLGVALVYLVLNKGRIAQR